MREERGIGSRRRLAMGVTPVLMLFVGCGKSEPEKEPAPTPGNGDHSLVGTWKVDWNRTLDAFDLDEGKEDDAARRMKALMGDFEMTFTAKTVTVRGAGDEEQAAWSTASTDGDTWIVRGPRSDLTLRWLGDDTIRLIQDKAPDGTERGLVLARR